MKRPDIAIMIANMTGLKLKIVGGSFTYNKQYLQAIKNLSEANPNVELHIDAPENLKLQILSKAKCTIVPSTFGEPFGLVAVESMACGTPVVATPDGALPEVVKHGKTGYIASSLTEMAEYVLNIDSINPKECRKHVERHFTKEKMAENYLKLYKQILNGDEW